MQITRASLNEAVTRGVLDSEQSRKLWQFLSERENETPTFKPAYILYYLGGLIAIGAMTLFMNVGWERFGGKGLLVISVCYCVVALVTTEWLLRRKHLTLPAGIAAALAVALVPLAVYGAQHVLGFWPDDDAPHRAYRDFHYIIDWRWVIMEIATLVAGAIALRRYRLPFLVLPAAVALWYMSMDLTPLLFGETFEIYSEKAKLVSTVFGTAMLVVAVAVDLRSRRSKDFAFWLYIFGVLTFWGGLSSMDSNKDSMLFPVALTAIGLLVIGGGVLWQRHEAKLGAWLRSFLPGPIRELVEHRDPP